MKTLFAALVLLPSAALAHPGDHARAEWLHLLTEPDHAAMIALGIAALAYGVFKLRARR
jgi:hypothetical protein